MDCEYVREYYDVPAEIGRIVTYQGKHGIIAADRGNYIGVTFDSEKPGTISNIHPTDEGLKYLGMGVVRKIKMTRSQKRYQEYLGSFHYEAGDSFAEFLGIA